MSVGANVNFGALKNQSEFWKSPGNLLQIKDTNPVKVSTLIVHISYHYQLVQDWFM